MIRVLALAFELLTVLMLVLTAATAWAYLSVATRSDAAWMAVLLPVLLPLLLRFGALVAGWRPLASALSMLLCLGLSAMALGLIRLGQAVGMRPDQVWMRIDSGTLLDLALLAFRPGLLPWLLLAVPAAATISWLLERRG